MDEYELNIMLHDPKFIFFFHLIGGIKSQRRRRQDYRLQIKAKDIVSYEHEKEDNEEKVKKIIMKERRDQTISIQTN
jgi:hypothetical protein